MGPSDAGPASSPHLGDTGGALAVLSSLLRPKSASALSRALEDETVAAGLPDYFGAIALAVRAETAVLRDEPPSFDGQLDAFRERLTNDASRRDFAEVLEQLGVPAKAAMWETASDSSLEARLVASLSSLKAIADAIGDASATRASGREPPRVIRAATALLCETLSDLIVSYDDRTQYPAPQISSSDVLPSTLSILSQDPDPNAASSLRSLAANALDAGCFPPALLPSLTSHILRNPSAPDFPRLVALAPLSPAELCFLHARSRSPDLAQACLARLPRAFGGWDDRTAGVLLDGLIDDLRSAGTPSPAGAAMPGLAWARDDLGTYDGEPEELPDSVPVREQLREKIAGGDVLRVLARAVEKGWRPAEGKAETLAGLVKGWDVPGWKEFVSASRHG
ncbi:hypothetical protein DFJ74DRAFT_726057 [Hyaloraphidium curvatum]|nr:hypothetical protein DFJ74DRAFT_726057 [Hyaloraphidium curvatum]